MQLVSEVWVEILSKVIGLGDSESDPRTRQDRLVNFLTGNRKYRGGPDTRDLLRCSLGAVALCFPNTPYIPIVAN